VARGRSYRKPLSVHGCTHRCWLIERSWCGSALLIVELLSIVDVLLIMKPLFDVLPESIRTEWSFELQGSRERSATLRQHETREVGMQVRTTATRCAPRVGKQHSLDRDDAQ
jgi:hypothetical protein